MGAVDQQQRDRRYPADIVGRAQFVADQGLGERGLDEAQQGHGGDLVPDDVTVGTEGGIAHHRPDSLPVAAAGNHDGLGAPQALPQQQQAVRFQILSAADIFQCGPRVPVDTPAIRPAGGCAVTAVVKDEQVEAGGRQPGDETEVAGHVLGVAVEVNHGSPGHADGRDEPAGEARAVLTGEGDLLETQTVGGRGIVDRPVGVVEHLPDPPAADQKQGQDNDAVDNNLDHEKTSLPPFSAFQLLAATITNNRHQPIERFSIAKGI